MSSTWQANAHEALAADGLKAVNIYGKSDFAKWAGAGTPIDISPVEMKEVVAGLADVTKFQKDGIVIGKAHFVYLNQPVPGQVIGRKGEQSVIVASSSIAVVVAYTSPKQEPASVKSITKLVDLLNQPPSLAKK